MDAMEKTKAHGAQSEAGCCGGGCEGTPGPVGVGFEPCDDFIETVSGRKFFYQSDGLEAISIGDIAHALAIEPRFSGHTKHPYSVARHSLNVYCNFRAAHPDASPAVLLYALLHDAHEAYTKDLPKPLRRLPELAGYNGVADRVQRRIEARFSSHVSGVDSGWRQVVKQFDVALLKAEAELLMPSGGKAWKWPPQEDLPKVVVFYDLKPDWEKERKEFLNAFLSCW